MTGLFILAGALLFAATFLLVIGLCIAAGQGDDDLERRLIDERKAAADLRPHGNVIPLSEKRA